MKTGKEMAIDVFAEIEMRQNAMKKVKKMPACKVAVAVLAMICVLCTSAFAVYHFSVPHGLEDSLLTKFMNIQPVLSEKANSENSQAIAVSTETDGCTIKFEAIADAEAIRGIETTNAKGEKVEMSVRDKFALFSIRSNDGTPVTEKYDHDNNMLGYCLGVPGYSPNGASFEYRIGDYYDKETDTLIVACLINEIEVFADKEPYIALFSGSVFADPDFIRMNEDGQPYFTDNYDGVKAIFTLPFDKSLADKEAQEEMINTRAFIASTDYSQSDRLLALDKEFRESGTDLSAYIGDNEWLGRYELKFGEVEFFSEYLSHRNDWKNEEHRLLTWRELNKVAEIASAEIAKMYSVSDEAYEKMSDKEKNAYNDIIREKINSADYCGGLPKNAEFITLPDGSKAYYSYGGVFLHIGKDNRISAVIIPNHKTVIEVYGADAILNTALIAYYNSEENTKGEIPGITVFGWLIDNGGIDYSDPIISDKNRDRVEEVYSSNTANLDKYDAEFETISYWYACSGTVQVLDE